ncbi:phytoene desaturase family protein [Ligilactobacillus acidipiscis]|uniref:phytoene desaturase family protein n=1 Tax=Ligilactobacillus acidipiscis TaxID=89059 RepID=UPI0023F9CB8A|nr:NAD(P)/FAD-dependent oxidoreductase [Ligilactobacillus acidipiscis]WEV58188.1 NAD(P)/FAD-dependent oxidoreductase [Ligilactobacillus acidipiscis]
MSNYDAIVVGSGNAGMLAALTMQHAGKNVLLLEQNHKPGGSSGDFVRGRFHFESSLHELMSGIGTKEHPGDLYQMFDELGVSDKVNIVRVPHLPLVNILPDGKKVILHHGQTPEELTAELIKNFPEDEAGIKRFMHKMLPFAQQFGEYLMDQIGQNEDEDYSGDEFKELRQLSFHRMEEIYDECDFSQDLRTTFHAKLDYFANTPTEMQPGFILAQFLQLFEDGSYVERGSQALTDGLIATFKEQGGTLLLDTKVKKILVEDGKTTGVLTEQGQTYKSDMVLSDMLPTRTYIDLVGEENTPESIINQMNKSSIGYSTTDLFLGLDCPPEEIGLESPLNFLDFSYDLDDAKRLWKTFEVPDHLLVSSHTVDNRKFSPEGTSEVAIFSYQAADQWINLDPSEYFTMKEKFAEEMLEKTERIYPNIREHIEEAELATPLTVMHYINEPKGSIMGWRIGNRTNVTTGTTMVQSPIKGLYTTGAGVGPGYYHAYKAGNSVAKVMLDRMKTAVAGGK